MAAFSRTRGGGHRLPDSIVDSVHLTGMIDRLLGPQNRDIQGPQVIWDFLKQFARHPAGRMRGDIKRDQANGSRSTMVWSRSGPVETMLIGQPANSSSARR